MDDQEAPPAVHGGGDGTPSSAAAAPFPPAEKALVDTHQEVGATSPSTATEKKKNVPATSTTAPFAATNATATIDPSDSDPENVGMPIEGDELAFDASGFSGGEWASLLVLCL